MSTAYIDIDRARRFVADRFGVGEISAIGAGAWSAAFAFEMDRRRHVIRFGRHPGDFRKDRRAGELYGAALRVPPVSEIGEAFDGNHYAVSDWAPGDRIDTLAEPRLASALPALLDTLDALRAAAPPAEIGFGDWTPDGRARHASWRDALLDLVRGEEHPRLGGWQGTLRENREWSDRFDEATAALVALCDACPDDARHLIHNDLMAGNVLVADARVSAVIDWGNSIIGDFLYDVAWLVFWAAWHPGLDPEFIIEETRARCAATGHDLRHFDERMRAYQLHIALDSIAYYAFRREDANLRGILAHLPPLIGSHSRRASGEGSSA